MLDIADLLAIGCPERAALVVRAPPREVVDTTARSRTVREFVQVRLDLGRYQIGSVDVDHEPVRRDTDSTRTDSGEHGADRPLVSAAQIRSRLALFHAKTARAVVHYERVQPMGRAPAENRK